MASGSEISSQIYDQLAHTLFPDTTQIQPASKASIEAMPEVEVSEAGNECLICLQDFEVGGVAKEMPCKHIFHGDCVEKWLRVCGTCPKCRYRMPAVEEVKEMTIIVQFPGHTANRSSTQAPTVRIRLESYFTE